MKTMMTFAALFFLSFAGQAAETIPVVLNGGLTTSVHNTQYNGKPIPACYFVSLVKENGNAVDVTEAYSFLAGQVLYLPVSALSQPCDREKVAEWFRTEQTLLKYPVGEATYERWVQFKKVRDGGLIRVVRVKATPAAVDFAETFERIGSEIARLETSLCSMEAQISALKTLAAQSKQLEQQVNAIHYRFLYTLVVELLLVLLLTVVYSFGFVRTHYWGRIVLFFKAIVKPGKKVLIPATQRGVVEPVNSTGDALHALNGSIGGDESKELKPVPVQVVSQGDRVETGVGSVRLDRNSERLSIGRDEAEDKEKYEKLNSILRKRLGIKGVNCDLLVFGIRHSPYRSVIIFPKDCSEEDFKLACGIVENFAKQVETLGVATEIIDEPPMPKRKAIRIF